MALPFRRVSYAGGSAVEVFTIFPFLTTQFQHQSTVYTVERMGGSFPRYRSTLRL